MANYTPLLVVENDEDTAMLVVDVAGPFPALEGGAVCTVEPIDAGHVTLILTAEHHSARIGPLTRDELTTLQKVGHFIISQLEGGSFTKAREVTFG